VLIAGAKVLVAVSAALIADEDVLIAALAVVIAVVDAVIAHRDVPIAKEEMLIARQDVFIDGGAVCIVRGVAFAGDSYVLLASKDALRGEGAEVAKRRAVLMEGAEERRNVCAYMRDVLPVLAEEFENLES
jgi:hypothetical protein